MTIYDILLMATFYGFGLAIAKNMWKIISLNAKRKEWLEDNSRILEIRRRSRNVAILFLFMITSISVLIFLGRNK